MSKKRPIRPPGRKGAAIWVSPRPAALHLADCDYFDRHNPPILSSKEEEASLPLCQWCATRMSESIFRDMPSNSFRSRVGPKKLPAQVARGL